MAIGDICIISSDLVKAVDQVRKVDGNTAEVPQGKARRSSLSGGISSTAGSETKYKGNFAIVENADGTYSVGNNALGYLTDNKIFIDFEGVTVPVTTVTVGSVYLRIDRRSLVGTLYSSCSIVQEKYSGSDDAVWEFYIGRINDDGTIEQAYTGEGGTTPLTLADNVKDFFELRNGNLSLNSSLDLDTYYVPVVMNGVLEVRLAEPLPSSAYEE